MIIALTDHKKQRIKSVAKDTLSKASTIREVASLLDNIVASFEAVQYGRLYYQHIKYGKITALKSSQGNFDTPCPLSPSAIEAPKAGVLMIILRQ